MQRGAIELWHDCKIVVCEVEGVRVVIRREGPNHRTLLTRTSRLALGRRCSSSFFYANKKLRVFF